MLQPLDLILEIVRLKANGDNNAQIAGKLDISDPVVGGLLALHKAGEERLLEATISGRIPLSIAMDIAKTDSVETQRALLKAYETKQLRGVKIRIVKRLIEQRRFFGKDYRRVGPRPGKGNTSAEGLVSTFRREQQRQRAFVRKAKVCEERLTFLVTAFQKLCADENFVNLLRAEGLPTMPAPLAGKLGHQEGLVLASPKDQVLNPEETKIKKGMSAEEFARMEQEMGTLERDLKAAERAYGENVLGLTVSLAYVKRLLGNPKVVRFLSGNHPEILSALETMAAAETL